MKFLVALGLSFSLILTGGIGSIDQAFATGGTLQVTEVGTPLYAIDVNTPLGDSQGGIATCGDNVLVNKDSGVGVYTQEELTFVAEAPDDDDWAEALTSDLETGVAYTFGDDYGTFNQLYEINCTTGAVLGTGIALSSTIEIDDDYDPAIFAGYGRIVVFAGDADGTLYNIDLATGNVTTLGMLCDDAGTAGCDENDFVVDRDDTEASYSGSGVAEYFDGQVHLLYMHDGDNTAGNPDALKRYSVTDDSYTTVFAAPEGSVECDTGYEFDLGDDITFAIDVSRGLLFTNTEYGGEFPWVTDVLETACDYDEPVVAYGLSGIGFGSEDPSISAIGSTRLVGSTTEFANDRVRWAWLRCTRDGDAGTSSRLPLGCRIAARGAGLGSSLERRAYRLSAADRRSRYMRVAIYADGEWHYSSAVSVR